MYTYSYRRPEYPTLIGILDTMSRHLRKHSNRRAAVVRNAGIYSRVSVVDPRLTPGEVESIESQDDECLGACEENRWPIHRMYSDPGISASEYAKDKLRPDWQELVADVASGAVNVVVLWETSRGERKPEEWIAFLNLCRRMDCLVHIMNHDEDNLGVTYNMDNADHRDKLSREGLDNAKESSKTSGRLRRLKRRRRTKGLPDGAIPFGYRRVYDSTTGKIIAQEPDSTDGAKVRNIFWMLAAQHSTLSVVRKHGIPYSSLRNIAMRKAYISVIEHDGEEYPAQWRPVLYIPGEHRDGCEDTPPSDGSACPGCKPDTATFYKVGTIFASRRLEGLRPGGVKYLVSCIAECSVEGCMGAFVGNPERVRMVKHGDGRRQVHTMAKYNCTGGHSGIGMDEVNTYVSAVIVAYYSKPGRYEELIKTDDADVVAAQADIDRIDAELKDLYARARSGNLSAMMAESLEQGLLRQQKEAQARRVSAVPPAVRDLLEGPVKELAKRWVAMPLAARREIIRGTVRVVIYPAGGKGRRVPVEDRVKIWPVRQS